jgi:hypothetical protein
LILLIYDASLSLSSKVEVSTVHKVVHRANMGWDQAIVPLLELVGVNELFSGDDELLLPLSEWDESWNIDSVKLLPMKLTLDGSIILVVSLTHFDQVVEIKLSAFLDNQHIIVVDMRAYEV